MKDEYADDFRRELPPVANISFSQVLNAYIGEWGAKNVVLFLPRAWRSTGIELAPGLRVKVCYVTEESVAVSAFYRGKLQVKHERSVLELDEDYEIRLDRPAL